MSESFIPKPLTMFYPVLLFAVGTWFITNGDKSLGVGLWVLGWLVVGWVIVADIMSRRVEYWRSVADVLNASAKNDMDKLASLGFKPAEIPESVKVELHNKRDGMDNSKYFKLPVSSARLVPFASAVLNGQPFTERRWTGAGGLMSTNEFRTLRGVMREHGLIEMVSEKDSRQGYKLSDTGREVFTGLVGQDAQNG